MNNPGVLPNDSHQAVKILVVDEDPLVRRLLQDRFGHLHYDVRVAESGPEALSTALQEKPHIIITERVLPGMDGAELCKAVLDKLAETGTQVIFLSSKNLQVDIIEGLDAGASDYVTKPFDPYELEARVRALLRRRG